MRGMAIYEDKIIVSTSDARLIAFDARNGKKVWETVIGDRSKGTTPPVADHRDQRQGAAGFGRLRALSRREVLHQRL